MMSVLLRYFTSICYYYSLLINIMEQSSRYAIPESLHPLLRRVGFAVEWGREFERLYGVGVHLERGEAAFS